MTPEQVSALSDNELNRAMIWLNPLRAICECLVLIALADK